MKNYEKFYILIEFKKININLFVHMKKKKKSELSSRSGIELIFTLQKILHSQLREIVIEVENEGDSILVCCDNINLRCRYIM